MVKGSNLQSRYFLLFILIWASLVQVSCESKEKNSVLVIAVENLGFSDINCTKEDSGGKSGIKILCDEAIRYTHAFTTSTMALPNISSILTGLYPYQHGVRDNGSQMLSPNIETVAKIAIKHDYRTAFFSGGAPLLRKTGIARGFEIFDDHILPNEKLFYRPFIKTEKIFEQWVKTELGSQTFLSFIYASDLAQHNSLNIKSFGEVKNAPYENQLENVDSTLYQLFMFLKKENRWHNTTIILTGLSGLNNIAREDQISPLNLHSENTQVAFFIKPQHKPRELEMQWKVDRNINLADVGLTLKSIIGEKNTSKTGDESFPIYSIESSFKKAQLNWPDDRMIIIESGWPKWHGWGGYRAAIISGYDLFINDEKPLYYNTLTDRLEQIPLAKMNLTKQNQYIEALSKIGYSKWIKPRKNFITTPVGIAAQNAIANKKWSDLLKLGESEKNEDWIFVAKKNLGFNITYKNKNACLNLLYTKYEQSQIRDCEDPLFIEFYNWLNADLLGYKKDISKKKFEQSWQFHILDTSVVKINFLLGRIWDVPEIKEDGPQNTDLALALPEYQKYHDKISSDLNTDDTNKDDLINH